MLFLHKKSTGIRGIWHILAMVSTTPCEAHGVKPIVMYERIDYNRIVDRSGITIPHREDLRHFSTDETVGSPYSDTKKLLMLLLQHRLRLVKGLIHFHTCQVRCHDLSSLSQIG